MLKIAYENNYSNVAVNLFAVLGVVLLLWPSGVDKAILEAWIAFTVAFSIFRFFVTRHVLSFTSDMASVSQDRCRNWLFQYGAGLTISALSWAPVAFVTFRDATLPAQYTLLVIISALAAGAAGTLAAQAVVGRIYITVMLLDATAVILLAPEPQYVLGGLGILFNIVMLVVHRRNHRVLRHSLVLRFENDDLLQALQSERNLLEHKVLQRTKELKTLSEHDSLTGAFNRYGLSQWIDERCLRADEDQRFGTIFIDMDRFKQINDGFGHALGDSVLRGLCERLSGVLPDTAAICRWGGDEFVAIVPLDEGRDLTKCAELVCALRKDMEKPIAVEGRQIHVNFSAGMAMSKPEVAAMFDSIRFADLASSEVKRNGRGRTQRYSDDILTGQERTLMIAQALKDAIASGELTIAVQPIVDAKTFDIASYEVLARWESATLGTVTPDEFIPVAEDLGEIIALGNYILETAVRKFAQMGLAKTRSKLAINVSLRQLVSLDFADFVCGCLKKHGLKPDMLEIEITESVFDPASRAPIEEILASLAAEGIQIHIDDFGTGYSSLSRLREMPISTLKIDQSFVRKMDDQSKAIIEGTILIARRFGIKVIAEGVETVEQAILLNDMGVDYLQGFLFGHPSTEFVRLDNAPMVLAETA